MMEDSMQTKHPLTFIVEHDVDMMHQYMSTKELSKVFATSRSSSSLDETASNSSLSSSSFSVSSSFTSISLSEQHPYSPKDSLVALRKTFPVSFRLPLLSQQVESNALTSTSEVEIGGGMRKFRYRRLSPRNLLAIAFFNRDKIIWEEVEDGLYILLDGRLDRLQICRDFYFQTNVQSEGRLGSRRSCDFLMSLGYLLSSKDKDLAMHDEHVSQLASFLSTGRDARYFKLAVVRTLYKMCLSTRNNDNNIEKIRNAGTQSGEERLYEFLTNRTREWDDELMNNNLSTEAVTIVYEIRAKCLRNLDLERYRIRSVTDTGNSTAVIIATGAKIVELGIQKSNKAIEGQISNAGQKMKGWIDDFNIEDQQPEPKSRLLSNSSDRDGVVVRAFSGSTKRASEYARRSSKRASQSTLDTTLSGFYTMGKKVEESTEMINQLSPESREIIKSAGKIGIASFGAVALVAEAFIETSRSLSSKTAGVTADIVGHKYGSVAGEVARDAADTYTNVLQTIGNITLVSNGSKLVKTAAKNAGKNQIDEDLEKAKQIMLRLERQGAIVAKQTLGIQWTEGSLTRELLCAAVSDVEKQESASIHPKDNFSDNSTNSSSESREALL